MIVASKNGGWSVSRKFNNLTFGKVTEKNILTISETKNFGFVLVVTNLESGQVRKFWNCETLESAQKIAERF